MQRTVLRYLSNFSFLIGFLGLGLTFGPYLWEELRFRAGAPLVMEQSYDDYHLVIPKIAVSARVIENVNPFDRGEYIDALQRGVAQARGTALPGESGTQYLFAHSSDAPWRLSQYNTIFYRLGRMHRGDIIDVWRGEKRYRYVVDEMLTVWPTEIAYLTESTKDQLIVQTCVPIGTDLKRLLVIAKPVKEGAGAID